MALRTSQSNEGMFSFIFLVNIFKTQRNSTLKQKNVATRSLLRRQRSLERVCRVDKVTVCVTDLMRLYMYAGVGNAIMSRDL